jgi:hypothetical protein
MQIYVFLDGSLAPINCTTLQVPNWVISKEGSGMHPITCQALDPSKHNDRDKA